MYISEQELAKDVSKYLKMAATEEISVTRDGKVVAKITSPHQDKVNIAKSLFGIIPCDVTVEEARDAKLGRI